MAEDQDDSQKTEDPSHKRLQESRDKGQVADSRELSHWFMILGATLFVAMMAPGAFAAIKNAMLRYVAAPHDMPLDGGHAGAVLAEIMTDTALVLLAPLGLLLVFALLTGLVQHGPLFAPELIKPKLEKISPMAGFKRMFSFKALFEFVKGLFKIALVGAVAVAVALPEFGRLDQLPGFSMTDLLAYIDRLAVKLLFVTVAVLTVIAAADLFYQRFSHWNSLKMSRQELRDELKQTDGDPMIKSRLRQIRMERARKRMMAAVPSATVVVTNPTHFAVALRYEHGGMEAPVVVAKGVDLLAARIRAIAQENDVPVVENPPLARALYAAVDLDRPIPPEHYKAVAEIIGYVMRLKRKVLGR